MPGSPGTLLSCIKRSLTVLADFHDMLEILISHAIIVVFHVHVVITVGFKAALRVPPAVARLTVYRRLHIGQRVALDKVGILNSVLGCAQDLSGQSP